MLLKWVRSCLFDHRQRVAIDEFKSNLNVTVRGIPQAPSFHNQSGEEKFNNNIFIFEKRPRAGAIVMANNKF